MGLKVTGKTKVLSVIGYPLVHSLSPLMHGKALEELRLDYMYVPFELTPDVLEQGVKGMKALGIVGINVTIPHKIEMLSLVDEVSEDAKLIGAVNTVHNVNGKLIGYNTDAYGFIKSLELDLKLNPKGVTALILGAGGSAKAVITGLIKHGAQRIYIANRTKDRAVKLACDINALTGKKICSGMDLKIISSVINSSTLIVNTTPVGMSPNSDVPSPVDPELIKKDHYVFDLIYNPIETSLTKAAKAKGAKTVSGLGMLAYQGALSFEIWTGKPAPLDTMKRVLIKELS